MEAAYISISRHIDKENVVSLHNIILFVYKDKFETFERRRLHLENLTLSDVNDHAIYMLTNATYLNTTCVLYVRNSNYK